MIDKQEQRRRAAALDAERAAQGLKAPVLPPIVTSKKEPWPFAQPAAKTPTIAAIILEPSDPRHPQHAEWKKLQTKKVRTPSVKKPKYLQEDFENEIGQRIRPGSRIIAVRQGYNHSVKIAEGTYLGLRRNPNGSVRSVTVQLNVTTRGYQVNGKKAGYSDKGATFGTYNEVRTVTLPRKRIYAIV